MKDYSDSFFNKFIRDKILTHLENILANATHFIRLPNISCG